LSVGLPWSVAGRYGRLKGAVRTAYDRAFLDLARRRRPRQTDTGYIAVTGSCAKTTTMWLIAAALPARRSTRSRYPHSCDPRDMADAILSVGRDDRHAVIEMSAAPPGFIADWLPLVRPTIGVVTLIGDDHYSTFRGPAAAAREKGTLVEALPDDGVAVLNADDPHVRPMAERTRARVLTFGLGETADVRGSDIVAQWPGRLSLAVRHGDERVAVETQLVGRHQAHSVLAAMAVGVAAGVPLATTARRIATMAPVPGRMCPVETADGITFLDDRAKAPLWSMSAAFEVLRTARARRKVAVIGHISDYPGNARRAYKRTAESALQAADLAVFVGPRALSARYAAHDSGAERLRMFETPAAAQDYLKGALAAGDLVLLKGSQKVDHMERYILARSGDIACWRTNCGRRVHCLECPLRRRPDQ